MRETDTGILDPDAVLDFRWDWSSWLVDGDTITSHELLPTGITVDSSSQTSTTVTAWLSDPDPGKTTASVTCRITTAQGRTDDRTLSLYLQHR